MPVYSPSSAESSPCVSACAHGFLFLAIEDALLRAARTRHLDLPAGILRNLALLVGKAQRRRQQTIDALHRALRLPKRFQLLHKAVDDRRGQLRQVIRAQRGQDVAFDLTAVYLIGGRLDAAQHLVFQPMPKPMRKGDPTHGAPSDLLLLFGLLFPEQFAHLGVCSGVDVAKARPAAPPSSRSHSAPRSAHPAACRCSLHASPFPDTPLSCQLI